MAQTTCTADGCDLAARKRGWCNKHYIRWYVHGDPNYERPTYTQCQVEACTTHPRSATVGLCEKHYYRIRRHGDAAVVIDTRLPDVRYRAAHWRTQVDRGAATGYPCTDCGRQAEHWSYDHTDPDERTSDTGQAYSLDVSRYEPRCRPCHAVYDGTGRNQYSA